MSKLHTCTNYRIPCPYARGEDSEMPCVGADKGCEAWREKYWRDVRDGKVEHPPGGLEEKVDR